MMRALLLAAALSLGACAGAECNLGETGSVSFSSADTRDIVSARAEGPSCGGADVIFAIHDADGALLYETSLPVGEAVVSISPTPRDGEITAFLSEWANPAASYTALAPPWEALGPDANVALERAEYERVRGQQWRMLCLLTAPGVESCIYWDPREERAMRLFDRRIRDQ